GEIVRLTITGRLQREWHTYPLAGLPGQDQLSKLVYPENPAFAPLWPVRETNAVVVEDKAFGKVKEYEGEFQWSQEVLVRKDAPPGKQPLKVIVDSQVCHDVKGCVPFRHPLEAVVEVSSEPAVDLTKELEKRLQEPPPSYAIIQGPKQAAAPGKLD